MTDLVTGEAVVLDLRLAKLASRSLALAIDLAVQLGLIVRRHPVIAGAVTVVDDALAAAHRAGLLLAVVVGYPVAFETLTRGRSLGQDGARAAGRARGRRPDRFRQSFVRGLLGVVEIWLTFGVGRPDHLAGLHPGPPARRLPGRHRRRARAACPCARRRSPPCRRSWPAGPQRLDLSRVPDDLALAARQFLGRAHELAPEVRERMGDSARPARWPRSPHRRRPPGVPAWAFLSAVLAERRRREMARLGGASSPPAGGDLRPCPPRRRTRRRRAAPPRPGTAAAGSRARRPPTSRPAGGPTVRTAVLTVGLPFEQSVERDDGPARPMSDGRAPPRRGTTQ